MRKILISLIAVAVTVPFVSVFAQKEKTPPVSMTFKIGADSKILLAGETAGALTDLKVGDKIGIAYHADGTTSVVDKLHVVVEAKGSGKTGKGSGAPKDGDSHVHGKITAIDTTAGTITVAVHKKAAAAPAPAPTTAPTN